VASYIPYGAYWSTPFAKWQGSLAHLHAVTFAAHVARAELARRKIAPETFDFAVLGTTVPQHHAFFGAPWFMGLIGADTVSGPTVNQACATGARALELAVREVDAGDAATALVATCDRVSNGPEITYPNPEGPGGAGTREHWVLDNFAGDPLTGSAMIATAENVARKYQIGREAQHELTLRRYAQYQAALADDRAFQKRYMTLPFAVPDAKLAKTRGQLDGDEGIFPTTAEGLAKLKPVVPDGTVTFGAQTHPADGNAAMVVTTEGRARELSARPEIMVRVVSFGQARVARAHMPEAPVPAARRALERADLKIADLAAIKSHNPFAVNDLVFARETGADLATMNNYGCSLVWGHPQGPTGLRSIIELIEELALRGGGYGLFQGCAAGDTGMAVVIHVRDA
jgi:acetyl-CoA acetyltransferase family protein